MGFQYGASVYPIDPSGAPTLLSVCDPALAKILDFLKFSILKYANAAVTTMLSIPSTDRSTVTIQSAVGEVIPVDPDTVAKVYELQLPLLCGWPVSTKYDDRTLNWTSDIRLIRLAYVLPAFTVMQSAFWSPLLNSISQICNAALKAGHDVDYNADERILKANSISAARLVSAEFGSYDLHNKREPPYFPCWIGELELVQQVQPYSVGDIPFAGADFTASHQQRGNISTFISADAIVGATTIRIGSTTDVQEKDILRIGEGTGRDEQVSVVTITDGTHLVIAAPGLAFAHTSAQADTVTRVPVQIIDAKSDVG